jgi:ABC-type nitrate/sulfonate/bicarbonate transport system permease component
VIEAVIARKWLASSLFFLAVLLVWEAFGTAGSLPRYVLAPSEILAALWSALREGILLPAAGQSLLRQMSGFLLGSTAGIVLGLLAGVSRWAEDVFDTLVSLTYPLPKIALFPVVVIWLGYTDTARIMVIAISCFYPCFINAIAGTRSIEPRLLWVSRNAGAGRVRAFRQVVLRASMPSVVNGVRLSLALSFILTFATESLGASRGGLGALIEDGVNDLVYSLMWTGIVAFALFGFLADQVWTRLTGRLLRGQRVEAVGRG